MCYHFIALYFFFFFKQKTAYEMRISDWSSDVCSSDLAVGRELGDDLARRRAAEQHRHLVAERRHACHHRRLDEARAGGRDGLRPLLLDRRGCGVDVALEMAGSEMRRRLLRPGQGDRGGHVGHADHGLSRYIAQKKVGWAMK